MSEPDVSPATLEQARQALEWALNRQYPDRRWTVQVKPQTPPTVAEKVLPTVFS